jgi:hypothetical protein
MKTPPVSFALMSHIDIILWYLNRPPPFFTCPNAAYQAAFHAIVPS